MKYCERFYALSKDIKDDLQAEGRAVSLVGEVRTPYGTMPNYIYYTGKIIDHVHIDCTYLSAAMLGVLYPPDETACVACANADAMQLSQDVSWEK